MRPCSGRAAAHARLGHSAHAPSGTRLKKTDVRFREVGACMHLNSIMEDSYSNLGVSHFVVRVRDELHFG
jgi:hypothetical protein